MRITCTSFQYTDAVLRFSQKNGTFSPVGLSESQLRTNFYSDISGTSEDLLVRPLPGTPEYRRNYTFQDNYYKGTFVQFGWPGVHDTATQGVRGVLWIKRLKQLWIANEDTHRVIIVNELGQYVGKIKIKNPIALYVAADVHDPKSPSYELVYVTSKKNPKKSSNKQTGAVYGINMHTWQVNKTFTILGGQTMNHPTSVVAHEDVLFVAEQNNNVVLSFNITSSRYIRQVFSLKSGEIEQLALSTC
jgi:hypothetical protein